MKKLRAPLLLAGALVVAVVVALVFGTEPVDIRRAFADPDSRAWTVPSARNRVALTAAACVALPSLRTRTRTRSDADAALTPLALTYTPGDA